MTARRWGRGSKILLCVAVFALAWAVKAGIAYRQRSVREAANRRVFASLQAALPPHTARTVADAYLHRNGMIYQQEFGPGSVAFDDFVRIGAHESTGSWVCSYEQPAVLIRFGSRTPYVPGGASPSSGNDDEVTGMEFRNWPMDCL